VTNSRTEYELELERLVQKWVKILRLTNWDYEIFVGGEFQNQPPPQAEVIVSDEDSDFTIRFQSEELLEPKTKLEALVIHELAHVFIHRVLPNTQTKANLRDEERVVNALVKILLEFNKQLESRASKG